MVVTKSQLISRMKPHVPEPDWWFDTPQPWHTVLRDSQNQVVCNFWTSKTGGVKLLWTYGREDYSGQKAKHYGTLDAAADAFRSHVAKLKPSRAKQPTQKAELKERHDSRELKQLREDAKITARKHQSGVRCVGFPDGTVKLLLTTTTSSESLVLRGEKLAAFLDNLTAALLDTDSIHDYGLVPVHPEDT